MSPSIDIYDVIRDISSLISKMSLNDQIFYEVPSCHYRLPESEISTVNSRANCIARMHIWLTKIRSNNPNINIIITGTKDGIKVHLYRK